MSKVLSHFFFARLDAPLSYTQRLHFDVGIDHTRALPTNKFPTNKFWCKFLLNPHRSHFENAHCRGSGSVKMATPRVPALLAYHSSVRPLNLLAFRVDDSLEWCPNKFSSDGSGYEMAYSARGSGALGG